MSAKPRIIDNRSAKNGLEYPFLVGGVYVNGKRQRKYFKTKTEASVYLHKVIARLTREGHAGFSLSDEQRVMAAKAEELLTQHGANLLDAAKHYVAHLEASKRSITFDSLSEKYRAAKKADQRSKLHLTDLKFRLSRFSEKFGQRLVAEITTAEVDDWLREVGGAPQSRENFRKVIHGAFSFAELHNYCPKNPVTKTARVKILKGPPSVLTPAQMRKLLAAAVGGRSSVIPYLVVGAFAGLRPSEAKGLDWSVVDLARSRLEVRSRHKTGHRWVDLPPNLVRWLAPFRKDSGPIAPRGLRRLCEEVVKAAEMTWEKNCLRHSYGSAHAVKHQNPIMTSSQMGNTPRVLLEHYRRLITPEDAAAWFEIVPTEDNNNVIQLSTAAV